MYLSFAFYCWSHYRNVFHVIAGLFEIVPWWVQSLTKYFFYFTFNLFLQILFKMCNIQSLHNICPKSNIQWLHTRWVLYTLFISCLRIQRIRTVFIFMPSSAWDFVFIEPLQCGGGREQTTSPKCNKFGKKRQYTARILMYL